MNNIFKLLFGIQMLLFCLFAFQLYSQNIKVSGIINVPYRYIGSARHLQVSITDRITRKLYQKVIADSMGEFLFTNVVPGEYYVNLFSNNRRYLIRLDTILVNSGKDITNLNYSPFEINYASTGASCRESFLEMLVPSLSMSSPGLTSRPIFRGNFSGEKRGKSDDHYVRNKVRHSNIIYLDKEENDEEGADWSSIPGSNESYEEIKEQDFTLTSKETTSTFSCDMDAAAYPNIRRMLNMRQIPPENSVRIEEMINYFRYENFHPAANNQTLGVYGEIAPCPWNTESRLAMIGVQAKKIDLSKAPPSNLVFLVDVSGSMNPPNRLPLVKKSLKLLLNSLRPVDRISLVTYAGNVAVVLNPTPATESKKIEKALDNLESGGGTAGASGIELAYKTALSSFFKDGNNRVILCTDGDFNLGISSDTELEKLITEKRSTGIYLSILGYGMGNYKDSKLEKLSNSGNGTHAYIDSESEAMRVLVKEFGGSMYAVANDVKLQTVFNPEIVEKFRLIGYDHRLLNKEDFDNDAKDAGEMGSDVQVTALYEVIYKKSVSLPTLALDARDNQNKSPIEFKIRYKNNLNESSQKIEYNLWDENKSLENASSDFRFASAVATWGLQIRNSKFKGTANSALAIKLAENAKAVHFENQSYRDEFVSLVKSYDRIPPVVHR